MQPERWVGILHARPRSCNFIRYPMRRLLPYAPQAIVSILCPTAFNALPFLKLFQRLQRAIRAGDCLAKLLLGLHVRRLCSHFSELTLNQLFDRRFLRELGRACGSPELDQVGQPSVLKATSAFAIVLLTKIPHE
jgi:hypothetical protein